MILSAAHALILHPVGFRPARAHALRVANLQDRELPRSVHFRARVAPIFAASVGLVIGLLNIPIGRGFRHPHFGGYVDSQGDVAIGFATADQDPIGTLIRGGATRKNCAQGDKQVFTCLHFVACFLVAYCVLAGGPQAIRILSRAQTICIFLLCRLVSFKALFLGTFSRVHEKKLVKKA